METQNPRENTKSVKIVLRSIGVFLLLLTIGAFSSWQQDETHFIFPVLIFLSGILLTFPKSIPKPKEFKLWYLNPQKFFSIPEGPKFEIGKIYAWIIGIIGVFIFTFSFGPERIPALNLNGGGGLAKEAHRYSTQNPEITLRFTPVHKENAETFWVEDTKFSPNDTKIEYPVSLKEGANPIRVKTEDEDGEIHQQIFSVVYLTPALLEKEKQAREERIAREKEAEAKRIEAEKIAEAKRLKEELIAKEKAEAEATFQLEDSLNATIGLYNEGTEPWEQWKLAELIHEGLEHKEVRIQNLAKKVQRTAADFQRKNFPKKRMEHAEIMQEKLLFDDFTIRLVGTAKDHLIVEHWRFAANQNIKTFHNEVKDSFYPLRFAKVTYRSAGSGGLVYTLDSLPDTAIEGLEK